MIDVESPCMRVEVIGALRSLTTPEHQRLRWGVVGPGVNYFDSLTLVINVLYDDTAVLPDPSRTVGTIIYASEVRALRALDAALSPMIGDLGNAPDGDYTADERRPSVVACARVALTDMEASGT